jgi:trans-aconitate methyltransferase
MPVRAPACAFGRSSGQRYPEAHVNAVDSSAEQLRRLWEKACTQGADDRVRTVQADLDTQWPNPGTPELVWASASMHHTAAPTEPCARSTTCSPPADYSLSSS